MMLLDGPIKEMIQATLPVPASTPSKGAWDMDGRKGKYCAWVPVFGIQKQNRTRSGRYEKSPSIPKQESLT